MRNTVATSFSADPVKELLKRNLEERLIPALVTLLPDGTGHIAPETVTATPPADLIREER